MDPVGSAGATMLRWLDDRLGVASYIREKLRYVFPEHFSFLFGEVALYSFIVLVATGIFLTAFYVPSESRVVYEGAYAPLRGVVVSEAFRSVVDLSFTVRVGLLMRQTHHWAALVFLGAIVTHLARVFFTGAFRRPRELNWVTGVLLLALASAEGFLGYSLLDDLLSGTGLRIAYSLLESIPVIGTRLAFAAFNGEFPGEGVLGRLFILHILVVPALLAGLIAAHVALLVRVKHTQFPGVGRTEHNVVGQPLWPAYATQTIGLLFVVTAVIVVTGAFLQINPVWLYGPFDPFVVTSASQADWYVLWTQGALRLMPAVELRLPVGTVPNQFFPAVLMPVAAFGTLAFWPWIEARMTGDREPHHLLDRPRDRPVRTAIGVAALTAFAVLLIAGVDDVIAAAVDWPVTALRAAERIMLVVLPLAAGVITAKLCRDLAIRSPLPGVREPLHVPHAPNGEVAVPSRERGLRERIVTAVIAASLLRALLDRLRR